MLIQNIKKTRGPLLELKREWGVRKAKEEQPQAYLSAKVIVIQGHLCFFSPSGIICIMLHDNLKNRSVPM